MLKRGPPGRPISSSSLLFSSEACNQHRIWKVGIWIEKYKKHMEHHGTSSKTLHHWEYFTNFYYQHMHQQLFYLFEFSPQKTPTSLGCMVAPLSKSLALESSKPCKSQKHPVELPWSNAFVICLLPRKLTWNPKMEVWKIIFLIKQVIFRFHVSFQWCKCLTIVQLFYLSLIIR